MVNGQPNIQIFSLLENHKIGQQHRAIVATIQLTEEEERYFLNDGIQTYLTIKFPILGEDGTDHHQCRQRVHVH